MTENKTLKLETPATYRIRVQGYLEAGYSSRLGGLSIAPPKPDDETPVTTLSGRLLDQAALLGVLNTLYNNMHLPLLLVECLAIGDDLNEE
jgi:hypothetical protein